MISYVTSNLNIKIVKSLEQLWDKHSLLLSEIFICTRLPAVWLMKKVTRLINYFCSLGYHRLTVSVHAFSGVLFCLGLNSTVTFQLCIRNISVEEARSAATKWLNISWNTPCAVNKPDFIWRPAVSRHNIRKPCVNIL